ADRNRDEVEAALLAVRHPFHFQSQLIRLLLDGANGAEPRRRWLRAWKLALIDIELPSAREVRLQLRQGQERDRETHKDRSDAHKLCRGSAAAEDSRVPELRRDRRPPRLRPVRRGTCQEGVRSIAAVDSATAARPRTWRARDREHLAPRTPAGRPARSADSGRARGAGTGGARSGSSGR